VDLQMPADFPRATYMAVEGRISQHLEGRDPGQVAGFSGYAGGWNGLAVRFRAADEYGARAIHLLATLSGTPPNEDRYAEESALFGFFANAVAAVESCCFAVYHMGLMAQPPFFSKPPDEVNVKATATAVANGFPGSLLAGVLARLNGDAAWREVKKIRNIFMHQASSPGRTVYVTAGRVAADYVPRPTEWTGLGIPLDRSLVEPHRVWLGQTIERLIGATDDFVSKELPAGK
jgi:hypothetical protein